MVTYTYTPIFSANECQDFAHALNGISTTVAIAEAWLTKLTLPHDNPQSTLLTQKAA